MRRPGRNGRSMVGRCQHGAGAETAARSAVHRPQQANAVRSYKRGQRRGCDGQAGSPVIRCGSVQSSVPIPGHIADTPVCRSRYGKGVGLGTPGAPVGQRVRLEHGRPARSARRCERPARGRHQGWRNAQRYDTWIASPLPSSEQREGALQDCALTRRWSSCTVMPGRPNASCARRLSLPLRGQTDVGLPDWHGYIPLH